MAGGVIELAQGAAQPRDICSSQCGAKCCRTPNPIVRGHEMRRLKTIAGARGIKVSFLNAAGYVPGVGNVTDRWQLQKTDGACPFLLQSSNLCGIYEDRPQICRDFPTRPITNCLLMPGVEGRDPAV